MMEEGRFHKALELILTELTGVFVRVEEKKIAALEEAIASAGAVFVTGEGRSGLVARCFAMRLMHLGLRAYVVGGTVTPAARPGDLLLAVSGSGKTATTCSVARSAARAGARVAAITAGPRSPLANVAALAVVIPAAAARGRTLSRQHGRSLFEQSALLLLDALVLELQRRLGRTDADMASRHSNLE